MTTTTTPTHFFPPTIPTFLLPSISPLTISSSVSPVSIPTASLTPKSHIPPSNKLTPTPPSPTPPSNKLTPTPPSPSGRRRFYSPPIQVKDLQLRPWQLDWAHRARHILLRNHGYIDTSRMRSGKTYVTLWLAKQFSFPLLIICPVIAIDVWKRTTAEYGIPVIDIISYQSLRSQRGHQPKHGLLFRSDHITEGNIHHVHFSPTNAYSDLIGRGIMLIFDEIQNIKNNSAQYKASSSLLLPLLSGGLSRFGLLSGTPFDKESHSVNLLKLIGYIRSSRLCHYLPDSHELVLDGIQELIDCCHFINSSETDAVLADIPLKKSTMSSLCYTLFTRVVKPTISGAMSAPTDITGSFNVANGFFNISPARSQLLIDAVNELADAVHFNSSTGTSQIRADNIGAVTTALMHIENAKTIDWARVASQSLLSNPLLKVIISVNYISTINEIHDLLLSFSPLVLSGEIPPNKRSLIVTSFNEDPSHRLLIMNTSVGGIGISLYSPLVNSPRLMLLSPSYKLLDVTQAAARIYGPGMSSDATVRMFYGLGSGTRETGILSSLARKTQVLKGTLEDSVTQDLVLPGDYPAYEEE